MEKCILKPKKENIPVASKLLTMVPIKRITQNQLGRKVQKLYSFSRNILKLQRLITNLHTYFHLQFLSWLVLKLQFSNKYAVDKNLFAFIIN